MNTLFKNTKIIQINYKSFWLYNHSVAIYIKCIFQ